MYACVCVQVCGCAGVCVECTCLFDEVAFKVLLVYVIPVCVCVRARVRVCVCVCVCVWCARVSSRKWLKKSSQCLFDMCEVGCSLSYASAAFY